MQGLEIDQKLPAQLEAARAALDGFEVALPELRLEEPGREELAAFIAAQMGFVRALVHAHRMLARLFVARGTRLLQLEIELQNTRTALTQAMGRADAFELALAKREGRVC